jgi:hypothetical protein
MEILMERFMKDLDDRPFTRKNTTFKSGCTRETEKFEAEG